MLIVIAVVFFTLTVGYIAFQSRIVQTAIISVITKNLSERTNSEISIKRVKVALFRKVILDEVYLSDQNKDTLLFIDKLVANIDSISFKNNNIGFKAIVLSNAEVNIAKLDSNNLNIDFLNHLFNKKQKQQEYRWNFNVKKVEFKNSKFNYHNSAIDAKLSELLNVKNINLVIDNLKIRNKDSISFTLEELSFLSASNIRFKELSAQIGYIDSTLLIKSFNGKTEKSAIDINNFSLKLNNYLKTKLLSDLIFDLDIDNFDLAFKEFAPFISSFGDIGFNANLSGKFNGNLNDLRGKKVQLTIGNFTNINGDFYLNGLPDINSAFLFLELNESFAHLNEIRNLALPPQIQNAINNLPSFLDNVGMFSYKGNFTGYLDDFVAYGTAYSNLGTVTTDVSFKPHKHEELKVNGHVAATNLDIGTIFGNDKIDKLSFNGELNGTLDYQSNYDLLFKGLIQSVDFNNYKFRGINLDGTIINDEFNGNFSIRDPNLHMVFNGKLDLSSELPVFNFIAHIDHANLKNLNIIDNTRSVASGKIDANFSGNTIDNVCGQLILSDIKYRNEIDNFSIDQVVFNNTLKSDTSIFTVKSEVVDGEIIGHYDFANIGSSFKAFYRRYLPSSYSEVAMLSNDLNDFDYHFHLKNITPIIKVFKPDLFLEKDIDISGYYKPTKNIALFKSNIPLIKMGQKGIENLEVKIEADSTQIYCDSNIEKIRLNNNVNVYNLSLISNAQNDILHTDLFWNNYSTKTYSGSIKTTTTFKKEENKKPHLSLKIEPSKIYFADSLWLVDKCIIEIDSTSVDIDNLNFYHNEQRFIVDGKIAEDNISLATAKIENIDLSLFESLIGRSNFAGKINGSANLLDFHKKFMLEMNLDINNLSYEGGMLGDLKLTSNWDTEVDMLSSEIVLIKDKTSIFVAEGFINPLKRGLDLNLVFDHSPISILQVLMPSTFNNQNGLVKGNVHLHGVTKHILHDGFLTPITSASIGLSYLNTTYNFNDTVFFKSDSIVFYNLKFYDEYRNEGTINGVITHKTFNSMKYNLDIGSPKLLALNTTAIHNKYFYGTAFASGEIGITGAGNEILISGDAKSEKGTNIFIPFESGENAEQYDFIKFVNNKKIESKEITYDVVTSGLNMSFDVEMTPDAKVQLIFNSQIGDIIKGEGSGNLQVRVDKNYNISLYGNYFIEEGDYLFTLQNIINKRFSIERGGTIEWVGDPYEAIIDISAVYKLKTSLSDLLINSYENIDVSRRIPVECVIRLSENLMQPKIAFSINLPTAEERLKDEVSQVIATQEDINKQTISLLMMGRFYTPEFFVGNQAVETGTGAQLVGTTASELISNQLTNWLSQITDVLDIGINYRPGYELTNNQVELALSTQILNDRVTLNGNIANNVNPNSNNTNGFIGDFDLNIKLIDNGKLQFKAYNHSNDNLIYDTAPYTQGLGFTYREEFNSINDLLKRYTAMFFQKEKTVLKNDALKKEE